MTKRTAIGSLTTWSCQESTEETLAAVAPILCQDGHIPIFILTLASTMSSRVQPSKGLRPASSFRGNPGMDCCRISVAVRRTPSSRAAYKRFPSWPPIRITPRLRQEFTHMGTRRHRRPRDAQARSRGSITARHPPPQRFGQTSQPGVVPTRDQPQRHLPAAPQ